MRVWQIASARLMAPSSPSTEQETFEEFKIQTNSLSIKNGLCS